MAARADTIVDWLRDEQRAVLLRERTSQVLNVAQSLNEDGRQGFEKGFGESDRGTGFGLFAEF